MKKYTLFLLFALLAVMTFAAPARRIPIKVKQSDGTELTVVLTGDESMHFYSTLDGKPVVKDNNGGYSYALFSEEGIFVSTGCLAHDKGIRTFEENRFLASIDYSQMNASIKKVAASRAVKYRAAAQKAGSQINPIGDVNVAVVLVQFQDVKFTYSKEDVENILNTKDFVYKNPLANSIGSARDYFIAQSDGKFRPNFRVTDIVTLDNAMSYYGGNDTNGDDKNAALAVKEGIQKADAAFDFSICDNNGDGEVEFVYCIYAGYSESYGADENTIWPHQWTLASGTGALVVVDKVRCNTYACSGELVYSESYEARIGKVLAGIGLICHEFSHCLGLHDIYDVTYESGNWGMDYWDVMDQGNYAAEGYVPVGYSAYQRDFCGWRDLVVLDKMGDYSIKPLTQDGVGYKVVNDANSNEYYILENRKQEGWDKYLFNSGMLVIHVDYKKAAWDSNEINVTPNHPRYTLIPADGRLDSYYDVTAEEFVASLKGDVWPGTSGNTELTNNSNPAAKVYTGGYMNKPIRDVRYMNDVISFNFMGGMLEVPQALSAADITATSFVANWNQVEGAEEYNVELYKVTEVHDGTGDTEKLLIEDFVNCTKTNIDVSSTINEYTSVSGWTGTKIYSEGGVLRVGTSSTSGQLETPLLTASGTVMVSFSTSLYNVTDTESVLSVSILDANGNVVASKDLNPTQDMLQYELSGDINGNFRVKFDTSKSRGKKRAKVDNILVEAVGYISSTVVEKVTVSDTNYKFLNLEPGCSYRFRVQAEDKYGASDFSAYETVVMSSTAVEDLYTEAISVEVYSLTGFHVCSGRLEDMKLDVPGVYIVKNGTKVSKIVVR